MANDRPSKLFYRARNGVVDTYIGSVEAYQSNSLQKFIERAINWSNHVEEYDNV